MITLGHGDYGTYLIVHEDGRDLLVQEDWNYPGVAETFGWTPPKVSGPRKLIAAAQEWLDDNIGAEAEDPGYFESGAT